MRDKAGKDYIDSNFNQLTLSDMYACKLQVRGGGGGSTNWLSITNEQAKAVHAILAGDRVLCPNTRRHAKPEDDMVLVPAYPSDADVRLEPEDDVPQ